MERRKCLAIVDGKECGLELEQESPESESIVTQYRCALGHRTHVVLQKAPKNLPGGKLRNKKKCN
jgi:hypothetical protein